MLIPARRTRAHRSPVRAAALALLLLGAAAPAIPGPPARATVAPPPDAVPNDHRTIAGTRRGREYALALELRRATWHPNAPTTLAVDVPLFAEEGRPASVPGPLIRVPVGTHLHITLRSTLAERAVVHGLHDHATARDSIVLAPGERRALDFTVTQAGTFAYFARTTATPTLLSRRDDSQLVGAFIVDPVGTAPRRANAHERLLVITAWDDSLPNPRSPYGPAQVYAINGRSWPFTERLTYTQGDSVHWRVLNLSQHAHPMHLHGTYFRVMSRGWPFADTALGPAAREVVTEPLTAGMTMTMAWKADRPGNWLFHCHTINHIDEALRLGEAATTAQGHADHGAVEQMMAGLVTAITVRPRRDASAVREARGTGAAAGTAAARSLWLVVTERASPTGGAPSLAYVLQREAHEPAADSLELPGSPLVLRQDEPTAITVVNRSRHATAVHWHGMELESYYDGVGGWSGAGARVAPMIAPGDSFIARMTPPRAGTFIYHTHAGELAQLTGGLYGALVVLPRGGAPDPDDRLLVLGDSTEPSLRGRTPPSMVNGRRDPAPIVLRTGTTHRLRMISIPAVSRRVVRLLDGTQVMRWTPVAKDGADLPNALRVPAPAEASLTAGETMDVLITPTRAGDLVLEVTSIAGPAVVTRIAVRVLPKE